MPVIFVNTTRRKFLKEYERLYRYTNLERFIEGLSNEEFTFINPAKWADPFERFFIDRDFQIDGKKVKLPAKDKIFSVCLSGTLNSEAHWKVYSPGQDGVRLTINTEKFLTRFLDNMKDCTIYIGKVSYQTTQSFFKINFNTRKLITEIKNNKIGDQQIKLMLKKRTSFSYEDEVRILVVPNNTVTNSSILRVPSDIQDYTSNYTFDPRMGKQQFNVLKEYFELMYGFKISHSTLYADKLRKPIVLR